MTAPHIPARPSVSAPPPSPTPPPLLSRSLGGCTAPSCSETDSATACVPPSGHPWVSPLRLDGPPAPPSRVSRDVGVHSDLGWPGIPATMSLSSPISSGRASRAATQDRVGFCPGTRSVRSIPVIMTSSSPRRLAWAGHRFVRTVGIAGDSNGLVAPHRHGFAWGPL